MRSMIPSVIDKYPFLEAKAILCYNTNCCKYDLLSSPVFDYELLLSQVIMYILEPLPHNLLFTRQALSCQVESYKIDHRITASSIQLH